MDRAQLETLLYRYRNGLSTEEELELIDDWLLRANRKAIPEKNKDLQTDMALTKILLDSAIDEHEHQLKKRQKIRQLAFSHARIAAVFMVILSIATLAFLKQNEIYDSFVPLKTTSFNTRAGQQLKVSLPDGTQVLLNSASSLSFNNRYGKTIREVILTGEGFFEVTPNAQQPLIVKAGGLKTTVLGTSFNISAYPSNKHTTVALFTGKVQVSASGQQNSILMPNQMIAFNKGQKKLGPVASNVGVIMDQIAWKRGRLIFSDTPVSEALQSLERAYNIAIRLSDERLAMVRINGEFGLQENPYTVVGAICELIGARYSAEKGKITVRPVN